MAENKRNRRSRYNNLKEVKKVILTKREDETAPVEAPKLLLKPKPEPEKVAAQPPAISLAVREQPQPHATAGAADSSSTSAVSTSREATDVRLEPKPVAPSESAQTKFKKMTSPLSLITDLYQVDPTMMSFLSETNDNFHVVGVLGTQGTGKSTLLNVLNAERTVADMHQQPSEAFFSDQDLFETIANTETISCNPTTEGIKMFVNADRTILLDSSPLLCNPYKKDAVLSEIDDIKIVSFMFSVCHIVLVVEEEPFNTSLLRLLSCANMMRLGRDKDKADSKLLATNPSVSTTAIHYPQVMFVHNLAKPSMFSIEFREMLNSTYVMCLQSTGLRVRMAKNQLDIDLDKRNGTDEDIPSSDKQAASYARIQARRSQLPLNTFTFPIVRKKEIPTAFNGHTNIPSLVQQFQQQVLYSPRVPFPASSTVTEMHWWHMVTAAWESYKSNYFLRKYASEACSRTVHQ